MKHKHREKPLAEITLRKYEKPYKLEGRELVKKLCLSLGMLQPGDGRDVVVDVFYSLLKAEGGLSAAQLEHSVRTSREDHKLSSAGVTSSNIRRQVKRLKDLFLVERKGNLTKIAESAVLHEVFSERIEKFYLPIIVSRVKEYCEAVERWKNGSGMSKVQ